MNDTSTLEVALDAIKKISNSEPLDTRTIGEALGISPEQMSLSAGSIDAGQKLRLILEILEKTKQKSPESAMEIEHRALPNIVKLRKIQQREQIFTLLKQGKQNNVRPKELGEMGQKLLEKTGNFENLRASEVLRLKQAGQKLHELLLLSPENPYNTVSESHCVAGSRFIVNFGKNESLKNSIGAGDILPPEVKKIKINGVEGVYANIPRPGYYEKKGENLKYLPIYDDDTIEIVETGALSKEEREGVQAAHSARYTELRKNEIMRAILQYGEDNYRNNMVILDEDSSIIEAAKEEIKERESSGKLIESLYGKVESESAFLWNFGEDLNRIANQYGIPAVLIKQIIKIESGFNYQAKAPNGSAYGLGQITDATFEFIRGRIPDGKTTAPLSRINPIDQIRALCIYLNYCKDIAKKYSNTSDVSYSEAFVYYHCGPNRDKWNISEYLEKNPAIKRNLRDPNQVSPEEYIAAISATYGLQAFEGEEFRGEKGNVTIPSGQPAPKALAELPWQSKEVSNGMTYCSRTTRMNAVMFGIQLTQGSSALESLKITKSLLGDGKKDPLELQRSANVAEIFLGSKANPTLGHRAFMIRDAQDQWLVADPYYNDTPAPVPYVQYLENLRKKGNSGEILGIYGYQAYGIMAKNLGKIEG